VVQEFQIQLLELQLIMQVAVVAHQHQLVEALLLAV
jgi:hypothetical protein